MSDTGKMSVSKLYTSARDGGLYWSSPRRTEQLCSAIANQEFCYSPSLPAEVQQRQTG